MSLSLPANPPFSLSAVVESHGWFQLAPFDWLRPEATSEDGSGGLLTRVEELSSGRVVSLRLQDGGDGVEVEIRDSLTAAEEREIVNKVTRMLQLERDLSAFYEVVRGEPRLAHVEPAAKGRILCSPTVFEDVVKTILTTNVQWSGTVRMAKALVDQYGTPLPGERAQRAFPVPERLAAEDEASLRSAGLGYRAPFVLELARAVASGARDLEVLTSENLPTDELRRRLLSIKGVGDYAAASLMMLLGRYDFVPIDSWARTMVSREWHDGAPVGRTEVEMAFARWGPWQGLAYWFWAWNSA